MAEKQPRAWGFKIELQIEGGPKLQQPRCDVILNRRENGDLSNRLVIEFISKY